jgi:hypothetical protein
VRKNESFLEFEFPQVQAHRQKLKTHPFEQKIRQSKKKTKKLFQKIISRNAFPHNKAT